MRFCHSFWTKPALDDRWRVKKQLSKDIWVFALSAHYVKKHGHTLVMHTDGLGEKVFGVLPYDDVFFTLEEFPGTHIFWAAGKIAVHRFEPLGSIHIDGDVFIKHPAMYEFIEAPGWDLIVQSYDWCPALPLTTQLLRPYLVKKLNWLFNVTDLISINQAYNCGVVAFRNAGLRREYVDTYADAVRYLSGSPDLLHRLYETTFKRMPADLVLEQKMLCALARRDGFEVRRIIDGDGHWNHAASKYEDRYEHLCFTDKYNRLDYVKETLKAENPQLYDRVAAHLQKLKTDAVLS